MTIPVNSVLPAITGTASVGSSLALSDGTWANVPTSFVYAWLRNGIVIAGEVTNAYAVALADIGATITGRVTATNVDGSTPATSLATTAVPSTLIPETGAVVAGADSYGSLTDANTYHTNRGNAAWAALTNAAKEAACRKATDYMLEMYRPRWKGYRKDATQTLDWPRTFVYLEPFVHGAVGTYPFLVGDTIVPTEVMKAWAELALRAAAGDLAPDLSPAKLSTRVGDIAVTYDPNAFEYVRFRAVDAMLAPYLIGAPNNTELSRT